jgi:hypothetical protein
MEGIRERNVAADLDAGRAAPGTEHTTRPAAERSPFRPVWARAGQNRRLLPGEEFVRAITLRPQRAPETRVCGVSL